MKSNETIGIIGLLTQIVDLFGQSREGSVEFQKALAVVNATFKSIVGSLGNAKDGFVTLFNVLVNAGQTAFTELDLSIVSFRKNILETLQEVSNFEILGEQIGIKDFSEDINVANTEIEALNTQGS